MNSEFLLFGIIVLLIVVVVLQVLLFFKKSKDLNGFQVTEFMNKQELIFQNIFKLDSQLKEDFKTNRVEILNVSKENRAELNQSLNEIRQEMALAQKSNGDSLQMALQNIHETLKNQLENLINKVDDNNRLTREELNKNIRDLVQDSKLENQSNRNHMEISFKNFQNQFDKNTESFNSLLKERFNNLDIKQSDMIANTDSKLNSIRSTVEEKLEKTLAERLGQSFETVGKQLIEVQKGLGEMQKIAQDVGGLKKVLSNVKLRGGIGEVQLSALLEQILAPQQYEANVKTKLGSNDLVEFAVKLPGKGDADKPVWLPIDAKFPADAYAQLQDAFDTNDLVQIESAQKNLEARVRGFAKDIQEKYIDPPQTTDFAIMFIPFEGIYAEIVRKPQLLDDLHNKNKVIVTGPTTLAAILNSLQMGFRTLAIEKRSTEVWNVLSAVKTEFEKFGGMMEKAQKNIRTGLDQLDELKGKRTRAIQRSLKQVQSMDELNSNKVLGLGEGNQGIELGQDSEEDL